MSDRAKLVVVVYAKDLVQVSRFYAGLLGADDIHRADDHIVLETPECHLVVLAIPESIAQDIVIASPPGRRIETPIKVAFPVDSIAAARAVAGGLGGRIDSPEHEWEFQGNRVCDGHDPEGNVLQLRQRLPPSTA